MRHMTGGVSVVMLLKANQASESSHGSQMSVGMSRVLVCE